MSDDHVKSSEPIEIGSHPKGTLAIVAVYGALFLLAWLILYFFVFVPRGTLAP